MADLTSQLPPPKAPGIFRIVHFSDIHAGLMDFHPGYLFDKRFFGRLNQFSTRQRRLNLQNISALAALYPALQPDFTVCTGDLTSIGSQAEFCHARECLKPILELAGKDFLLVPGNHDAYVKSNLPALEEHCRELNHGAGGPADMPWVIQRGGVEIIAVNGARPCHIWQSTGELTHSAWDKLDYILRRSAPEGAPHPPLRVVVCHFPLIDHKARPLSWRTKLIDPQEQMLTHAKEGRIALYLSGHVHLPFVHCLHQCNTLAVGAGSLTIHNSCAVVDINTVNGECSARIIQFS